MKNTKRNPLRTEAAIKRAVVLRMSGEPVWIECGLRYELHEIQFVRKNVGVIAIADLRDLYRKRAPIRMKDLRKAIQPRKRK